MLNWIYDNRAWLFSGVLVAIPVFILTWLLSKRSKEGSQKQKGGHGSANIQVGRDLSIRKNDPE
jgi:hypothetical protein